jgi:hypothetical protein
MAFVIRTEEISLDEILDLYVPTEGDASILEKLKSKTPIVLVGSRGMGKSFLFKVSQVQTEQCETENIVPVFVTFRNVPTLKTGNKMQFQEWMLNRICSCLIRTLYRKGYLVNSNWTFSGMAEEEFDEDGWPQKLENINKKYENSWKKPGELIDTSEMPTIDDLLELVEDICESSNIDRFIIYIDEAAHVFIPEQQIQFFSLFRELRSPYLKCNASVYPGVTYFGKTFDKTHDAEFVNLSRSINSNEYINKMKEMVMKQVKDNKMKNMLENNEANFTALAYAASGNPRTLLRSIQDISNLRTETVNKFIREFYREEIWAEHSDLVDKYPKFEKYIDWGRNFAEDIVLPELKNKNDRLIEKSESTIYFWIDRNAPEAVKESLRILEYTGIIKMQAHGVKATGSVIGTRFEVNLGCLLSQESSPVSRSNDIIKNLTVRKLNEYGGNSKFFEDIKDVKTNISFDGSSEDLLNVLSKSVDELQLTNWQKNKLKSINVNTIKDLLLVEEVELKKIYYVGDYKSRHMKNVAMAAMFEYLY